MGDFRRIYPSSSAPLQAKYEWLLQGSARLFASSMKAKAHNTIGRIQVSSTKSPQETMQKQQSTSITAD